MGVQPGTNQLSQQTQPQQERRTVDYFDRTYNIIPESRHIHILQTLPTHSVVSIRSDSDGQNTYTVTVRRQSGMPELELFFHEDLTEPPLPVTKTVNGRNVTYTTTSNADRLLIRFPGTWTPICLGMRGESLDLFHGLERYYGNRSTLTTIVQ